MIITNSSLTARQTIVALCKVEAGCNSGAEEGDKLPGSFVQFPGRNTKQMDYVKEVESGINKQNAEGRGGGEGARAKTSIQKNGLEQ